MRPVAFTLSALAEQVNLAGSSPASKWCVIREWTAPRCEYPLTDRLTCCSSCASFSAAWGLYDTNLLRAHGPFVPAITDQCPSAISNRNDEKPPFLAHCSFPSACSWDDYYDHLTSSTSQLFVAVPDVPRSEHPYQSTCCSSLPRTCAVFTALPAPIYRHTTPLTARYPPP